MENNRLQEDLLKEFKEEKEFVFTQIELLEPLAVMLRKPIAARVWANIYLLFLEGICWLMMVSVVAFCIVRDKVYPFFILARLRTKAAELGFSERDVNNLYWSVIIFAAIIIVLLFFVARSLAKIRKKNTILQLASKNIKTVVGEHLKRKAAINVLNQRHFGIIEPGIISDEKVKSIEVPNLGI